MVSMGLYGLSRTGTPPSGEKDYYLPSGFDLQAEGQCGRCIFVVRDLFSSLVLKQDLKTRHQANVVCWRKQRASLKIEVSLHI